jgi:tetratricopeptide (TPR) repeat protein
MPTLKSMLQVCATVACFTTVVACEEADPPRPPDRSPPAARANPSPPEVGPAVATPEVGPAVAPSRVGSKGPTRQASLVVKDEVATDDDSRRPGDLVGAARAAMTGGQLDRALALAERAVAQAPARAAGWNTLGRVQLAKGRRKAAISSFQQAVELNPQSSYAQNNLGLALLYERRYEEAVDALEEATGLEPAESYMFNNLGMAYEHLDLLDEARQAYRKAVELNNDRATGNLARLEGVKTVFRTARAELEQPGAAPDGGTH